MKIIEGLKGVKDLQRKADDLKAKIAKHSAISSIETETYPDQKGKVAGWLQAHSDIIKEILRIRIAIQRTNLEVPVTIEINGKQVTKCIAEWIHRRRDLAENERKAWRALTDKNIQEGFVKGPADSNIELKVVRFYDPSEKDHKVAMYDSEPSTIDAKLEIANAVTDLIE